MPATYPIAIKNARLGVVRDAIDAGSGPGVLVIGTLLLDGSTGVLATIPLSDPCGSIVDGVLTFLGEPILVVPTATGIAAKAELRDSDGNIVVSDLTADVSVGEVRVNTTSLAVGQTLVLLAGAIHHA